MNLDNDAFSTGQVLSKIWLAEELEHVIKSQNISNPLNILIIGGWYGLLNFILQTRGTINISLVRSIDIDSTACETADIINKAWVWQDWQFKSICHDANTFQYTDAEFNLIINTSVEHITSRQWFENIPNGTVVALQSNDMPHEDHCHNHTSLDEFIKDFKLSKIYYAGEKLFKYPEWEFNRFMIIGIK
jgi:hypothetical protein